MNLLNLGLVIWCLVHFIPGAAPRLRAGMINTIGEAPYKIAFTLLLILAIVFMVWGWRSSELALIYIPPHWSYTVTGLLVTGAFILMAAGNTRNNIKRFIRHPQLSGILLWSAGHLLANGDNRSVVLFGVFGLWAIAEILLINRRDGAWQKPDPVPLAKDIVVIIIGIIAAVVFVFIHPYLFGVSPIPA